MYHLTPLLLLSLLFLPSCISRKRGKPKPVVTLEDPSWDAVKSRANKALLRLKEHRALFSDEDVAEVCLYRELRELDLSHTQVTSQGLHCLGTLRHLEYLNLQGTEIGDDAFVHLATLPNLTILDLSHTAIRGWRIHTLLALSRLERLYLSHTPLSRRAVRTLSRFKRLKRLSLRGVPHPLDLSFLKGLNLTHLDLAETTILPHTLKHLWTQRGLEGLNLSAVRLSGRAPCPRGAVRCVQVDVPFKGIAALTALQELYVVSLGVGDDWSPALQHLKSLKHLDLSGNPLTEVAFASLSGHTALRSLYFSGEALLRPGGLVQELVFQKSIFAEEKGQEMVWPRNLEELVLTTTDLGDHSLRGVERLTVLRRLEITQTRVTKAGVDRFRSNRPNCEVLWFPTKVVAPPPKHPTPGF